MDKVYRLADHFPNGTKYVIEGRDGRILLRYLEFPGGRRIDLPADLVPQPKAPRKRTALRS